MLLTQTIRKGIKTLVYSGRTVLIPFQFDYAEDKGIISLSYTGTDYKWQEDRFKVSSEPLIIHSENELWEKMDRYLDPFDNIEAGMKLFAEQGIDTEEIAKLTGEQAMKLYRQEIRKVLDKDH